MVRRGNNDLGNGSKKLGDKFWQFIAEIGGPLL